MTNPNPQSSEFEESMELVPFATLENQLRSLPMRGPSTSLDSRMEALFQNDACALNETNDQSVVISDRSDGRSCRESPSTASVAGLHGRSGFVLPSASIASVVAVLLIVVAIFSGAENRIGIPTVGLTNHEQKDESLQVPEIARSEQSDLLTSALLTASSQIVESERGFARSVAVAWEQQTGVMFEVASHIRDLRFSECRQCHRRLSSAWHHGRTFQPDVSVCLNCHRGGG